MTAASQDEVIGEAKDVSSFQVAPSSGPPSPPALPPTGCTQSRRQQHVACKWEREARRQQQVVRNERARQEAEGQLVEVNGAGAVGKMIMVLRVECKSSQSAE